MICEHSEEAFAGAGIFKGPEILVFLYQLIIEWRGGECQQSIIYQIEALRKVSLDKVCSENCKFGHQSLGHLSPWTIGPWTIVATPRFLLP